MLDLTQTKASESGFHFGRNLIFRFAAAPQLQRAPRAITDPLNHRLKCGRSWLRSRGCRPVGNTRLCATPRLEAHPGNRTGGHTRRTRARCHSLLAKNQRKSLRKRDSVPEAAGYRSSRFSRLLLLLGYLSTATKDDEDAPKINP